MSAYKIFLLYCILVVVDHICMEAFVLTTGVAFIYSTPWDLGPLVKTTSWHCHAQQSTSISFQRWRPHGWRTSITLVQSEVGWRHVDEGGGRCFNEPVFTDRSSLLFCVVLAHSSAQEASCNLQASCSQSRPTTSVEALAERQQWCIHWCAYQEACAALLLIIGPTSSTKVVPYYKSVQLYNG